MANVLGTLFGDIADAIRAKSGESGTMKPAEFPEKISGISTGTSAEILENIQIALDFSGGNQTITAPDGTLVKTAIIQKPDTLTPANIAQGVNIAGIIGTLTGGSGGSGALTFVQGDTSKLTGGIATISHNMGVVPDMILVYAKEPPIANTVYFCIGFSDAMLAAFGGGFYSTAFALIDNTSLTLGSNIGFEAEDVKSVLGSGYGHIHAVDTSTFKFGGSNRPVAAKYYGWIAISGIMEGSGSSVVAPTVTFCNYDGTELYSRQVFIGDDCPDPVTQGKISTPTKASTAQYYYTHNGWSTAAYGTKDENALKNITEDKTVYAAYSSAIRYYTISFYDGGTLLKSEQYAYGTTPTYEPTKADHAFTGWEPAITKVTEDASYNATWSTIITFQNATWEQLAEISESGEAATRFTLGEKRSFQMTVNGNTETVEVQIAGFNMDDLSDGTGKAGMTLIATHLHDMRNDDIVGKLYSYTKSPTYTWVDSYIREYFSTKIYNGLPESLRSVVKQVSKKYQKKTGPYTYGYADDYCWIPSIGELGISYGDGTVESGTTKYPVFTDDTSRTFKTIDNEEKLCTVRNSYGKSNMMNSDLATIFEGQFYSYAYSEHCTVICFCI